LDLPDRIVPANRPLWLVLVSERDLVVDLGGGAGASRVETLEADPSEVAGEFAAHELPFVRTWFRELSEDRPWVHHPRPEETLVEFDPRASQLFAPLVLLHEHAPDHPRLRSIWAWTHKFDLHEPRVELRPPSGHESAPRWAVLQRELLQRCRRVLHWWIENRQSERGEFGDDWNDDTDFIQNFPGVALLGDPGAALRASAKRVADGVYASGRMRESGLSSLVQGPLHAYEDGANAQQVMALLDPGNPLYLERLMQSARAVQEKLLIAPRPGRSSFRSARFSADEVISGPWEWDSTGHAVLLAPALTVSNYNRNARAVAQVRSWADTWLDEFERAERKGGHPPGLPFASRRAADGTVLEWDRLPRGWGFASIFPALYSLTGSERYRQAVRFWTDPPHPGAFLETMPELHLVVGLVDPKDRSRLLGWSRKAELRRLSDDALGDAARRRVVEWELTGNESAAIAGLEAAIASLDLLGDAYTWAEPINDRIWLPFAPLSALALGGVAHQRNQLWPQHDVSYEDFSDIAAWVREHTGDRLRIWLYSFAPDTQRGSVRFWRLAPGRYRVRVGPDSDSDGIPDTGEERDLRLQRFSLLPVELAPGTRTALELRAVSVEPATSALSDLAVSEPRWNGTALGLTLHNLGNADALDALVRVVDAEGRTLTEQHVKRLEAPTDLSPRRQGLLFEVDPARAAAVLADPDQEIPELNETNNHLLIGRRSSPTRTGG
jgi:hypothetical protein